MQQKTAFERFLEIASLAAIIAFFFFILPPDWLKQINWGSFAGSALSVLFSLWLFTQNQKTVIRQDTYKLHEYYEKKTNALLKLRAILEARSTTFGRHGQLYMLRDIADMARLWKIFAHHPSDKYNKHKQRYTYIEAGPDYKPIDVVFWDALQLDPPIPSELTGKLLEMIKLFDNLKSSHHRFYDGCSFSVKNGEEEYFNVTFKPDDAIDKQLLEVDAIESQIFDKFDLLLLEVNDLTDCMAAETQKLSAQLLGK